jgi:tRNA (cmo5U34)-methyltransferase
MVKRCKMHVEAFKGDTPVKIIEGNIQDTQIENASMVVLNFTLQFIEKSARQALLNKIAEGLKPGGLLVLSEKISNEDRQIDQVLVDLHHNFKRDNGYSELEVAQKRSALEKVMLTDSLAVHQARLSQAGFNHSALWFQCFNFTSMIAIK